MLRRREDKGGPSCYCSLLPILMIDWRGGVEVGIKRSIGLILE
jgi:hypothetical protein